MRLLRTRCKTFLMQCLAPEGLVSFRRNDLNTVIS